jgi:hypothetical protein
MQRSDLAPDVLGLIAANLSGNLVEEAVRYRALTELSILSTDELVKLAVRTLATGAPIPLEEPRSFASADEAGYWG